MVAQEEETVKSRSAFGQPTIPSSIVNCRYKIQQQIGSGTFGVVHKGVDRVTGEEVAVKFERKQAGPKQLLQEARFYKELAGTRDVPRLYWSGTEGEYNIMVLELLGSNLNDLCKRHGHKFSMETVLNFWEQMIDRLSFLHSRGIIHRDLKPENFLVGTSQDDENLYMIDFGLSKRYVNVATGKHIPMRLGQDYVGTPRFISGIVHSGWEPCRRDDLISAGYVALLLLVGELPWQNLRGQQSCHCKRSTSHKKLCEGLPDNFVKYFNYCCGLWYDDTPDYNYLKQLIRNSCVHDGSEAGKRPSPAKNSDTNTRSYKVLWDEISTAAVKKFTSLKERLPDMLAQLMYKSNLQL